MLLKENQGKCFGRVLLYTVKICYSYWFNNMLIGQQSGRKYRQGGQTRRIREKGKAQSAVATQMQRKHDENAALRKGTKLRG